MNTVEEKLTEQKVTYTLELDGKFYIIENVPARVNEETGEQYFSPETVEKLREKIRGKTPPKTDSGIRLITAKVVKDGFIVSGDHEFDYSD